MSAFRSILLGWWLLLVAFYTFAHPSANYLQVDTNHSEKDVTAHALIDFSAEECLIPRPCNNPGIDIKNLSGNIPFAHCQEVFLLVKNINQSYSHFSCSRSFNVLPTFSSFHAFW